MDYMTLNALAITVLAAFGLWAFQRGARGKKNARRPAEKQGDAKGKR